MLNENSSPPSPFVAEMSDDAVLRDAWQRVQGGGRTPGVDGMTTDVFRAAADRNLTRLRDQLRGGEYRPSPLLRVEIPKPDGGRRLLGVPTIIDRVAQTAAALVLHDRVAVSFSDRSFAYRPFLGPKRAAYHVRTLVSRYDWVVTADIAKFFDNVNHRVLHAHLRNAGVDEQGIALLLKWLRVPVRTRSGTIQPVKGLPQGSPVSPVLANLHLTGFDGALQAAGFAHVRYADDFVVLTKGRDDAERALRYVASYLQSHLFLELKPAKTQVCPIDDGFSFVGYWFTASAWTIPAASIERFRAGINTAFESHRANLRDAWQAHNDLARGWSHYYGGLSPEMDQQLAELDIWRDTRCRELLAAHGDTGGVAAGWFEPILTRHGCHASPAGYDAGTDGVQRDPWHPGDDATESVDLFSRAKPFRRVEIARRQLPHLLASGYLHIPTYAAFVSRSRSVVVVRRKKDVLFEAALSDLKAIVIESEGIALSVSLMQACARRGIPVMLAKVSGRPYGQLTSAGMAADAPTLHAQVRARVGRSGFEPARDLVDTKLKNQRALLLYHAKYRRRPDHVRRILADAARAIATLRERLAALEPQPMRETRPTLFLLEAHAALHYWRGFGGLTPSEFGFQGRVHRGAVDVVNKSLNYGYGVLQGHVWAAVRQARLEPALGLLHSGRKHTPALVFDLMEPFRQPVVDRAVLSLCGRGASLALNRDGDLTMRTRRLIRAALDRRLRAVNGRQIPVDSAIRRQAVAFRNALMRGGAGMWTYSMTW